MYRINVGNIDIDIVRKKIKNIHLAVYPPNGRVRLAVPSVANEDTIRLFAVSKLAWIKRQQRKYIGQERISPREYKNRESHYFRGRRYMLNIIEKDEPPRIVLKSKTYIDMYIRPNTDTEKRNEIMNEWYRAELKKQITVMVEKWEKMLNVKLIQWQVKLMKTRWGSCNIDKKHILVNLELAKKPEHCLEYIIVHEMIHFLERYHNDKFIHYLDKYLPNWKQLKTELNELPVSHSDWKY